MRHTNFVITRFQNRNGVISWRVDGRLHDIRIRKNFKTREEAAAEKQTLELKALQFAAGQRAIVTALTDEQVREAETVFRQIAGKPHSLSFYVDFALANYREPETQKLLKDAVAEYVAAKNREFAQDQLSIPHIKRIRYDLDCLTLHFKGSTVAQLTIPRLIAYLEMGHPALKTYNNRRGIVSTFLKFAFHRGWIQENPMAKIPQHRIRRKRGSAQTLTVAAARSFMEKMEDFEGGRWIPYFAICLFAGLRPSVPNGEITRLKPDAVSLEKGEILISAEVSKVREVRKVALTPNLAAWLRAYPLNKFPIIPANGQKRRSQIAQTHGLTHDVLRHTFISMFVAKYRSIGEAAIQAGNSESIIRKHYLDLKSAAEAEEFFSIVPKKAAAANPEPANPDAGPMASPQTQRAA